MHVVFTYSLLAWVTASLLAPTCCAQQQHVSPDVFTVRKEGALKFLRQAGSGSVLTLIDASGAVSITSSRTLEVLASRSRVKADAVLAWSYANPILLLENGRLLRWLPSERSMLPLFTESESNQMPESIRFAELVEWKARRPHIVVCGRTRIGRLYDDELMTATLPEDILELKSIGQDVVVCTETGTITSRDVVDLSDVTEILSSHEKDSLRSIAVDQTSGHLYVLDRASGRLRVFDQANRWKLLAERKVPNELRRHRLCDGDYFLALWDARSICLLHAEPGVVQVMFSISVSHMDVGVPEEDVTIVGVTVLDATGSFAAAFSNGVVAIWNSPIDWDEFVAPDWPQLGPSP